MHNNDNKKPNIGGALFNMLTDMTQAQSRIYAAGGSELDAALEVNRLAALHRPVITSAIVRRK